MLTRIAGVGATSVVTLLSLANAAAAAAQVRASERATVSQVIDGTTITLDYSRPVARGRERLFGRVVRWNESWTPGANWATTLEISNDIQLNGQTVAKGKYSMWMIPREQEDWTVFLSENERVFHTQRQDPKAAKATMSAKPQQGPHVEVLTWSFPEIKPTGGTMQMQWGTFSIPLEVAVPSSRPVAHRSMDWSPYLGSYHLKFRPEEGGGEAFELDLDVIESNGKLRGKFSQSMPDADPEFDLVPTGTHTFKPVYYKAGKPFEEDEETSVVFLVSGGRASAFEFRFQKEAYARGTRK